MANEIVGYNIIHNLLDIFVPAALNKEVKPYKGYDGKLYSLISKIIGLYVKIILNKRMQ